MGKITGPGGRNRADSVGDFDCHILHRPVAYHYLNFISTTLDLRTKGMTLMRMPLSTWAWSGQTSCIGLLAFAVLLPACILLILDRVAGTSFFHSGGTGGQRSVATAFRWIAPALAAPVLVLRTSRSVHRHSAGSRNCFSRLDEQLSWPLLSHKVVIHCMIAIGFLSYMVWAHHMFVSGMNPFPRWCSVSDPGDYNPGHDFDAHLDWQPLWFEITNHGGVAVCPGIRFHVRQRRVSGFFLDSHRSTFTLMPHIS